MSGFEEWLPLLMAGNNQEMLPLILMLLLQKEQSSCSSTSEEESNESIPTTFDAYLASLVGEEVQVSVASAVDNGTVINGRLTDVGTDFLIMQNVWASGVEIGYRPFLAIPLSNVIGVNRLPRREMLMPLLELCRQRT